MDGAEVGPGLVPRWAVQAIIGAGRRLDARGLAPATSGNVSVRLGADRLAVTRSGAHKGFLAPDDVMEVDFDGRAVGGGRPSAETGLHCQVYRLVPEAGAVVHWHSIAGTVLSITERAAIRFSGYELLKAFPGQTTHETSVALPVVENDQDIVRLAGVVEPLIRDGLVPLGYMIRGHGAYVWGADMARAMAQMEGLEFLLACELERRRIGR